MGSVTRRYCARFLPDPFHKPALDIGAASP